MATKNGRGLKCSSGLGFATLLDEQQRNLARVKTVFFSWPCCVSVGVCATTRQTLSVLVLCVCVQSARFDHDRRTMIFLANSVLANNVAIALGEPLVFAFRSQSRRILSGSSHRTMNRWVRRGFEWRKVEGQRMSFDREKLFPVSNLNLIILTMRANVVLVRCTQD